MVESVKEPPGHIWKDGYCINCYIAYGEHFLDVPSDAFYADAVKWAAVNGVTTGLDPLHFGSNQNCSRAQIVTFLWRAAGEPAVSGENPFVDVPSDSFYADAVVWAVENGITNGVDTTHFAPEQNCSRAQIVTFLWRAAGEPQVSGSNPFTDVPSGEFYYNAVLWAVKQNITSGTDPDSFSPNQTCSRAQAVTFLYRANPR